MSLGELTFEYPEEAPFYIKDLKEIVDGRAGRNEAKVDLENPDDEVCRQDYVSTDDISVAETGDVIDSDDEDFPAYEIPESERNLKVVRFFIFYCYLNYLLVSNFLFYI